jgi:hypothetical protein
MRPWAAPGTPVYTYLRVMYLKFHWGLSYEELECEVRERLPWRYFYKLSLMDPVPDSTTLIKLNQKFGDASIEELNKKLNQTPNKNEENSTQKNPNRLNQHRISYYISQRRRFDTFDCPHTPPDIEKAR